MVLCNRSIQEEVIKLGSIDRLDAEILRRLTENARVGVAELATELGVSRGTVQLRMRRLEDSGVLLGFMPIVDLRQLGLPIQAYVSLELDQRKLASIVEGLRALPEVLEVSIQAGREDLVVQVALESLEALQVLTALIVELDGVRKTTSTFTVSTPVPYRIQPLLELISDGSGWGRATPAPL